MEINCGRYLLRYLDRHDIKPKHDKYSNKCMVIIDTRCSFWLPLVIRNFVDKLPGWNLYFFGPDIVNHFIQEEVGGEYTFIPFRVKKITKDMYNRLLKKEGFWKKIKEEHILIFQIDSLLIRGIPDNLLKYDYIGAVCGYFDESRFIMNGGLSLRKRSSIIKACALMTEIEKNQPEDVAFTSCMRRLSFFRLPTREECNNFSIESTGNYGECIGIHGTDKYYNESYHLIKKY